MYEAKQLSLSKHLSLKHYIQQYFINMVKFDTDV